MVFIKKLQKQLTQNFLSINIRNLLEHHHLTISELSRQTGVPKTTLFTIINENNPDPRIQTLQPIADFFNLTIDALLREQITPGTDNNKKTLPIVEWQDLNNFLHNATNINKKFTLETPASNNSFILKTTKSMRPRFMDNTLLILDPEKSFEDGDIVLIHDINDNNYRIKELFYDGTVVYLLSINPNQIEKQEYNLTSHQIIATLVNSVFTY